VISITQKGISHVQPEDRIVVKRRRQAREFCTRGPDGRPSDRELHKEILANRDHPAAEAVTIARLRRQGYTEEQIAALFGKPIYRDFELFCESSETAFRVAKPGSAALVTGMPVSSTVGPA
jgi:hypothetical protein